MTAEEFVLRLFWRRKQQGGDHPEWLELGDDQRLRELLIAYATAASRNREVDDLSEWRVDIHLKPRRGWAPNRIGKKVASVTVDDSGRTVVDR